ncbi:NADH-quinone oxidoreductase subunit N [Actinopolyspora biskrensis]|uniref:NADH-quinone oxidoreductase subunit N n=1 Tax=Actinopolyspora biskrensis TaxID=1470178 RepID=A0A852YQ66_9ACTN|nr:NADH-quinone oxidoreductase subunit N [Actinopolyspora biskrensis]NYH77404.1 NADH-quinone oxidoreductase subunit N [Actinopolyspora biskrensis]
MSAELAALLPELALAAGAVCGLLLGSWLPRYRQWPVRLLAALACLVGLVTTASAVGTAPRLVFGGSYAVDTATNAGRFVVLAATLLTICLSVGAVGAHHRETEFHVLVLLAALGTVVLVGACDLLLLFAGYLLASVPLYALAGFGKDSPGTEAALKYYLVGALLGVTTLAGITVLYGAGRSTGYATLAQTLPAGPRSAVAVGFVAVLAGLLFKSGAVPGHFWIPDVAEGASAPVAAFVTTVPKVGGLVAVHRLVTAVLPAVEVNWPLLLAVLAAVSMSLGNLAAFFQDDVRRLLAYSTVSQVGYLLLAPVVATGSALALPSLLFYLGAYAVTNLGAFAVVAELPRARRPDDYRGLARRHPGMAAVLVLCLLGLVGTPPTAVFLGKLEVLSAAVDGGYAWLAVFAVVNTVASLFYYLRWIAPALLRPEPERGEREDVLAPAGSWSALGAYAAGAASLGLGLAGGAVLPLVSGPLLP